MKKVLVNKNNTRVNSKNLNPSTLIEDLSNNVHTENIALDAVINVIGLNNVSSSLPAAKKPEVNQADIVVIPSSTSSKKVAAVVVEAPKDVVRPVRANKRSVYDGNSSDSEGDIFPPSNTIWTPEVDAKLRSAHKLFGDDWNKISAYLDIGQSGADCMSRWEMYANPNKSLSFDSWSQAEIDKLRELINHQQRGVVSRKVNWKLISADMNREVSACQAKWRSVHTQSMQSGRFTPEEDDLIIEEVGKWGDRGQGLWKLIEKKLNRSAESIYKHYNKRLSRRGGLTSGLGTDSGDEEAPPVILKKSRKADVQQIFNQQPQQAVTLDDSDSDFDELKLDNTAAMFNVPKRGGKGGLVGAGVWTPEMDAQLIEAQLIHGNDWVKVAEYCNNGQTNKQCGLRWNLYLDPKNKNKKTGEWSPEEVEQLKSLVVDYQTGGVGHKINWTAISRELNRDYNACKNKWKTVVGATMKKGPFTADEDELIIQRVAEWGSKGHGLWTSLEKEMGRSLKFIFQRWKLSLQKQVEVNAMEMGGVGHH